MNNSAIIPAPKYTDSGSATPDACRADLEWDAVTAAGVHRLTEELTGCTCHGAGACVVESHMFAGSPSSKHTVRRAS